MLPNTPNIATFFIAVFFRSHSRYFVGWNLKSFRNGSSRLVNSEVLRLCPGWDQHTGEKHTVSLFTQPLPVVSINVCIFVTGYQLTDAALAHELVAANGEPGARYYVLLGRLKIQQKSFIGAEENLKQAVMLKHQVICVRGFPGVSIQLCDLLLVSNLVEQQHMCSLLLDFIPGIFRAIFESLILLTFRVCIPHLSPSPQPSCNKSN